MIINDIYEEYIDFTPLSPRTKELYKECYNKFWKNKVGKLHLEQLCYEIIQSGVNELVGIYSYNTIKIFTNSIFKFIKIASLKNNIIFFDYNNIFYGYPPAKKEYTVEINEFYELILHIRKSRSKNKSAYEMACWLGLFTGMRISEILSLKKENIDFDNNEIHITEIVKSPSSIRNIYIHDDLKRKLLLYIGNDDNEKLFTFKANELSSYISNFARPRHYTIHFHSFREMFVKSMVDNGINFEVIRALIGHKNINSIMDLYLRSNKKERKDAIIKVFDKHDFDSDIQDFKLEKEKAKS